MIWTLHFICNNIIVNNKHSGAGVVLCLHFIYMPMHVLAALSHFSSLMRVWVNDRIRFRLWDPSTWEIREKLLDLVLKLPEALPLLPSGEAVDGMESRSFSFYLSLSPDLTFMSIWLSLEKEWFPLRSETGQGKILPLNYFNVALKYLATVIS